MRFRNRNKRQNPFAAALVGIGLFLGSFVMLYLNEGRVDLSKIADDSVPVSAETVSAKNDGQLVAVSGVLHSDEQLGDDGLLASGEYLQLNRSAEMYAWDEDEETDDNGRTTYDYDAKWMSDPDTSGSFEFARYNNPPMPYDDEEFTVNALTVGEFSVDTEQLFLMDPPALDLTEGMLVDGRLDQNYIYFGRGTLNDPEIGDIRISYTAFPNDVQATVFGEQDGRLLRPYVHKGETTLYRAYASDMGTAVAAMRTEYVTMLWIFRLGGFLMMGSGLALVASPLTALLGGVPLLGNVGRRLIGLVAFGVAFVLSAITIVISAILHSPVALIIIAILVIAGIFVWRQQVRKRGTAVAT